MNNDNEELPVEILEARRQIKAKQVGSMGITRTVTGKSVEDALGSLGKTLAAVRCIPDTSFDAQQRQMVTEGLRQRWNAPERHRQRKLSPEAGEWNRVHAKLRPLIGTGFMVALVGKRGPGKTQLGVELMRRATQLCRSAYYCTAMDIFMRFKDSFRKGGEESQTQAQRFFLKPKLLVIDEMNVRSDSTWEDNVMADLAGKRYNGMLDTVFISNETAEEFTKSVGPSITGRVNETGGIVACNWKSFRDIL